MKENTVETNEKDIIIPDMLIGSSSPHIRTNESVNRIMLDVIIALVPAILGSIYLYRGAAVQTILLSVVAAVIAEVAMQKLFKKPVTIKDLSAVVTGILLAFNIPAGAPWYVPVFGSVFAIVVAKQLFGGLGQNFINPALAGRAALMASWPSAMTTFSQPVAFIAGASGASVDAATYATPLVKLGLEAPAADIISQLPSLKDMFLGNIGGTIGETSALLLLIGAAYLIYRGVIDWKVPVVYILSTAVVLVVLGVNPSLLMYHILSGGLILGACFMATDYVSIPVNSKGRVIFAIGAGLLTAIIRVKGGYPEGVSYSILLMNVLTPIIEKFTTPKVFGRVD